MTIFLIVILLITQVISYAIIGFIVEKNNANLKDIAELISNTYLTKIEKDFEANKPSEEEGYDLTEIEELSPEEEFALRTVNSTKKDSGDEEQQ